MASVGLPNIRTIPSFVKARSPKGLQRLLLREQARQGGFLRPLGTPIFVDGHWYLWFLIEFTTEDEQELINRSFS